MAVSVVPVELKQLSPFELEIAWSDHHKSHYQVRNIRLNCHCAHCVNEWTQEKLIEESKIPQDIRPNNIQSIGRYALRFSWSDGHDTGFYRFDLLRSLCECDECKTP